MSTSAAQQQARSRAAGAAAAGAAAAGPATLGIAATQTAPVPPELAAAATGQILTGFIKFLAQNDANRAPFLTAVLARTDAGDELIRAVQAEEQARGVEFDRRAVQRVQRDLPRVLAIRDPAQRTSAVNGLIAREQRYAQQRIEAMAVRAHAATERANLKETSPLGALWKIGAAEQHTAGCLFLDGKFWPWSVLDRVHPPRHGGCTSRLVGYGEAVSTGLMDPGAIPDEATAIRMASGIVMEADEADALLAALDD